MLMKIRKATFKNGIIPKVPIMAIVSASKAPKLPPITFIMAKVTIKSKEVEVIIVEGEPDRFFTSGFRIPLAQENTVTSNMGYCPE